MKESSLGERLKHRRKELGFTQDTLAEKVGEIDPEISFNRITVSQIENGTQLSMRDKLLLATSKALNCNPEWLVYGRGPKSSTETTSNITQGPIVEHKCPVLSWVQAGAFTEIMDPIISDEHEYFPCPTRCGPNTFILRIVGDSMSPRFEQDDLIYVDPDQQEVENGKFVVAQLEDSPEATFKKLQVIDGKKYLVALNPSFPPELKFIQVNGNCRIVGTVIAHVKPI